MKLFLSHNSGDKDLARSLGAQLKLTGADVWFDEWEIRAGDSIPGKLNEGLAVFEVPVVIWSTNASRSNWVRAELETAISRGIADPSLRVIPVVLDETPLPALMQSIRYLKCAERGDLTPIASEIMGFQSERDRIKAIQEVLHEADIEVDYFHGYGAMVGCPQCGAGLERLHAWSEVDEIHDDRYAGGKCLDCGWNGGGEV